MLLKSGERKTFENLPFLDSQSNGATVDEAIRNYGDFIDLYFQTNRNLLLIRYSTKVDSEDAKQLIVTALSIKANDSIQAAVNLLLLGLESDAKALIRVALEAIIILKTVCVDIPHS